MYYMHIVVINFDDFFYMYDLVGVQARDILNIEFFTTF